MSYQVCAHTRYVAADPQMRVEISADTRIRVDWDQIWPNFEIFVKCLYGQEMASYAWKIIEKTQKGPKVSIYILQAHFSVLGQNPKIHFFHYLTCHITHNQHVEMCHMGAYTHSKPFF